MKKLLTFLLCLTILPAFAEFINENTQLKWNSKVIEKALNNSGFINSNGANWDVRTTRNHILEDLLTRQMFSVIEAIDVCKEQCNKSDFLKNGRGQSGKKCPELCESFANNIIKVNKEQYTSIPGVSATSNELSNLQGKAIDVCRRLMSDATTNGISYPVLCGGRCDRFGQDKVQITDLVKTKEYEVDDFCNNDEKGRDYFYILSDAKGANDVSSLNESQRIEKLKEIQAQPADNYMKEQVKKKKEAAYAKIVQQNGDCQPKIYSGYNDDVWTEEQDIVDRVSDSEKNRIEAVCKSKCHRYADSNACRITEISHSAFAGVSRVGWVVLGHCECNSNTWGTKSDKKVYIPTYESCMHELRDENECLNKR